MHILFLSAWHPWPPDNGSRIRVSKLLRALAARHEVSLVTFAGEPGSPDADDLVDLGLCQRAVVLNRPAFRSTRLDRWIGMLSPMPSHLFANRSSAMAQAAGSILATTPADLVIASTTAVAQMASRLPAPCRVLEEHNFLGRMMRDQVDAAPTLVDRARAWPTWRKDIAWERRLFRRFNLVTMVSDSDKAAVAAMGCATTRIEVVPNGVDAKACAAVNAQMIPDTVIYPGAVTYDANLDAVTWFAQQVWPLVQRSRPQARFLVTGKTDGVDTAALARTPGLVFTGYLADVRPAVAAAQVCVIPLRQGGGSRLKVLEAMALGVPVLSTSKGIEGLDLQPGQHCLVADEPAAFAAELELLLADPALGRRLAVAALDQVVPRYDWPPIAGRFVDLVEAVTGPMT
ncbi:MAG: glycosyltransferase [Anaerolineae bacterium]